MALNKFADWDDWLKQETYDIYQTNSDGEPEYLGSADGHDANHAVSKFAQYDERNPSNLTATRTWMDSKQ